MKKRFYTLVIALIGGLTLSAQFPGWAWLKSPVGISNGYSSQTACATDALGNVYVAGNFGSPTLTLGSHTVNLTDSGGGNFFLAKYDASGNPQWAETAGGDNTSFTTGVAVDNGGFVYVCGWFFGDSMVFPGKVLHTNHLLVTIEAGNAFIAKYDLNGNFYWAVAEDTTSFGGLLANSIAISPAGGVYVTGVCGGGPLIFGGDTLLYTTNSNSDAILIKLDATGNVVWAHNTGATQYNDAFSVVADAGDNAYITGTYEGGPITFGATTLSNYGNEDIFIAKYNPGGTALWAKSISGNLQDVAYGIATDAANSAYITGYFFSDSITFGSLKIGRQGTGADFYLARFDSTGNPVWLQQGSGNGINYGQRLSTDNLGNIFVTGSYSSSLFAVGTSSLTLNALTDGFIASFKFNGQFNWATAVQGTGDDYPTGIAADGAGNCYVVGASNSISIPFGTYTFNNTDTPQYEFFIAKAGTATTGIDLISDNHVILYPNACTDVCTLMVTTDMLGSALQVLDINGKLIYKSEIAATETQIPVSNFEAGVYIIKLTAGGKQATGKLVVTK